MVEDQTHYAKVAALSIAHTSALVKLLRAHGHENHAENVEAALEAFVEIVSTEVEPRILTQAMNTVSDAAWGLEGDTAKEGAPH